MAPQMGLIGFYRAQGYEIAYMALLVPFWPVGILLKRYNEVILFTPFSPAEICAALLSKRKCLKLLHGQPSSIHLNLALASS